MQDGVLHAFSILRRHGKSVDIKVEKESVHKPQGMNNGVTRRVCIIWQLFGNI